MLDVQYHNNYTVVRYQGFFVFQLDNEYIGRAFICETEKDKLEAANIEVYNSVDKDRDVHLDEICRFIDELSKDYKKTSVFSNDKNVIGLFLKLGYLEMRPGGERYIGGNYIKYSVKAIKFSHYDETQMKISLDEIISVIQETWPHEAMQIKRNYNNGVITGCINNKEQDTFKFNINRGLLFETSIPLYKAIENARRNTTTKVGLPS